MTLFDELIALLGGLEDDRVDYALAGALALAVWGVPRATQDIDLLVPPEAVAGALAVGRRRGLTVEALPIRFADGMEMRRLATDRGPIWVVSRDGLIQMKTAAGRPQDLVDVQRLQDLDR